MTENERKAVLRGGMSGSWQSEPWLGGYYGEEEVEAVVRVLRASIRDTSVGFGFICDEIEEFERVFAEYIGTKYAISIANAGVGLDMSMRTLDLEPHDEVIVPSINYWAAPMAVLGQRAKLVLCEVDPVTFCADPNDVEKRITPNTRAILPTHMNGMSAPMDDLMELGRRHPHPKHGPIRVIGDAARAVGGGYRGTKIGKKGWMNIFSFHTMKNMTTLGEGGAITTDYDELVPRLRQMRHFGQDYWSTNYKITKLQAAVGPIQVRRLDGFIAARRRLGAQRTKLLEGCPHLVLPSEPEGHYHSYYLYTVLVSSAWAGNKRDELIRLLIEKHGVHCQVLNPPVHRVVPYIAEHTKAQHLPLSDELGKRLFCLPIHPCMSEEDNHYISAALWDAADEVASSS
jgi:dTDP-4-amino-4,6-dideoxygalactose transaminase